MLRCKRGDIRVVRREMANWVGGGGIAGKDKGLAPAAAEIDFAPLATAAGLLHPSGAAKCIEGRRVYPNLGK